MKLLLALIAGAAIGFVMKQNKTVHVTTSNPINEIVFKETVELWTLETLAKSRNRGVSFH